MRRKRMRRKEKEKKREREEKRRRRKEMGDFDNEENGRRGLFLFSSMSKKQYEKQTTRLKNT